MSHEFNDPNDPIWKAYRESRAKLREQAAHVAQYAYGIESGAREGMDLGEYMEWLSGTGEMIGETIMLNWDQLDKMCKNAYKDGAREGIDWRATKEDQHGTSDDS